MPYILNTEADRQAMLQKIGVASIAELFQPIPDSFRLQRPLQVPAALSEIELQQHMTELGGRNVRCPTTPVCFLGGGSYDHFIPSVVDAVASRSEYYTAYTPYRQGRGEPGEFCKRSSNTRR